MLDTAGHRPAFVNDHLPLQLLKCENRCETGGFDMKNKAVTRVRARSMYYGGWVGFVLVTLMTVAVVPSVPGRSDLGNCIGVAAVGWVIAWFIWLVAHTRLDVDDHHIVVINTFTRWDIPWPAQWTPCN
jgi:hypothetical protein